LGADDELVFFNFRKNRPRQIVSALGLNEFEGFDRGTAPLARITCLMPYDAQPKMSARAVAGAVIDAIAGGQQGFILVNFANDDMVGHTAVREAVIRAVEVLDHEVGRVLEAAVAHDYSVIVTADHGNCEEMIDRLTDEPHTQHTVYPVPCLVIDQGTWQLSCVGGLANVAPTVLKLMGLQQPDGMSGRSLLLRPLHAPSEIHRNPFRSAA
jgi:2,3-bisphosphoglycerate-independent phosphoglycerate mutase